MQLINIATKYQSRTGIQLRSTQKLFSVYNKLQSGTKQMNLINDIRGLQVKAASTDIKQETKQHVDKLPYGRLYNFSAGPATLPNDVLEEINSEMFNYKGTGVSVMEMSHRSKPYGEIHSEALKDLRELLKVPDNYYVILMQGGATLQFANVPLNLTQSNSDVVNYITTGSWSVLAAQEAEKYGKVNRVAECDGKSIPDIKKWNIDSKGKYLYLCSNETINGVEFKDVPDVGNVPLVADMSSNFLSRPVDVSKYALIHASAQKNIGPAGVTIVIVRKDICGNQRDFCPTYLDYKTQGEKDSLMNTPPCFPIYVCGKMFKKMLKEGGVEAQLKRNSEKAQLLYDTVDNSGGFYVCHVDKKNRSNMNVVFNIPNKPELEKKFPSEAAEFGLLDLKGHRSTGGMRASIYNAMSIDGVKALVAFMKDFQERHG